MNCEEEFDFFGNDNIDLTPVIDVLFLLLIFFIMTTTFAKPVVNVLLPEAESASAGSQQQEMVFVIDSDGTVFYEDNTLNKKEIAALMMSKKRLPINFQVDKDAPFGAFMLVLDQARQHNRTDFAFSTRKGKAGEDKR